jgi:hypothetical protein
MNKFKSLLMIVKETAEIMKLQNKLEGKALMI